MKNISGWNRKICRRMLLRCGFYGSIAAFGVETFWWELEWLRIRQIKLSTQPRNRIVHFTDTHYKGDRGYLHRVIDRINDLGPDLVCFTGDIVEENHFLDEALNEFARVRAPLFGVPGNHDYASEADCRVVQDCFRSTGGQWLLDATARTTSGGMAIHGSTCTRRDTFEPLPGTTNLALFHYPERVARLASHRFGLMLAGHSHGGQVRLPFYGALLVPAGVGKFEKGMYRTPSGSLYVNPGIGCFYLNARLFCRPELTRFEL